MVSVSKLNVFIREQKRECLVWFHGGKLRARTIQDFVRTPYDFSDSAPIRKGAEYRERKHYEGWYPFSRSGKMLYYESLLEKSRLKDLDHSGLYVDVSTQPFALVYPTGTEGQMKYHFPDFYAVRKDGTQVLFDLRPHARRDAAFDEASEVTREICGRLFWGYEVLEELLPARIATKSMIRPAASARFSPPQEAEDWATARASRGAYGILLDEGEAKFGWKIGAWVAHCLWHNILRCDRDLALTEQIVVHSVGSA